MSIAKVPADYLDKSYTGLRKVSTAPSLSSHRRASNYHSHSHERSPAPRGKSPSGKPGMMRQLLGSAPAPRYIVRARSRDLSSSPVRDDTKEEAIKMASYPNAKEPDENVPAAIERDDWPAPPAPAAFIPQRLRERRENRGKPEVNNNLKSSNIGNHNNGTAAPCEEEDDDGGILLHVPVNPQLNRELDEMTKLQGSPMARVIREELAEEVQAQQKRLLDPRSASRVPAANKEPVTPHRFLSSVDASPSRSADHKRVVSDSGSPNTAKSDLKGSHAFFSIHPESSALNGRATSKSSTLPPGTPGAYVYDVFCDDDDDDAFITPRPQFSRLDRKAMSMSTNGDIGDFTRGSRLYKSTASAYEGLGSSREDTNHRHHQLQRDGKYRGSTMSERIAYLKGSTSWKSPSRTSSIYDGTPFTHAATLDLHRNRIMQSLEDQITEPEKTYAYEEVRLDSANRPKGLQGSKLEKYLTNEDFEKVLGLTREEFVCLPFFKQSDLKKRVHLF